MALPTTESTAKAIGSELQGFGGFLRCSHCGEREELGSVGTKFEKGWPKCCGYTMEWITQRQIDEGYLDDPEAWNAKERDDHECMDCPHAKTGEGLG